jgi:hypothetical protein
MNHIYFQYVIVYIEGGCERCDEYSEINSLLAVRVEKENVVWSGVVGWCVVLAQVGGDDVR